MEKSAELADFSLIGGPLHPLGCRLGLVRGGSSGVYVSLWLAAVNSDLLKLIERSPLGAALGRERMFFNLHKALEAWLHTGSRSASTEA